MVMGGIGIWGMHFIGNRAIILGSGQEEIQIVYSDALTVLSAFLPMIGLAIAFSVAEYPVKSKSWSFVALGCTGIVAGLSIAAMHYVANIGISNYDLHYAKGCLAASFIIAILDCFIVLCLFYKSREKWINSLWKRVSCAILLAGGVSSMHFTASTHCTYTLKTFNSHGAILRRDHSVTIAGVLCGAAAIATALRLIMNYLRHRNLMSRSQKVMLSCAMFDPDGRVLVTTEGILPSREITDRFLIRTFDEEFDTAHPTFQWIFRVTRDWSSVSEFTKRMRAHVNAQRGVAGFDVTAPGSSASSDMFDSDTYRDYNTNFRERFCVAADSLASEFHFPVSQVGVLFDRIIETGTVNSDARASLGNRLTSRLSHRSRADVEAIPQLRAFGKGQVLILTRRLGRQDTDQLINAGFRFGEVQQISRQITNSMQVPLPTVEESLEQTRRYLDNLSAFHKPGTWLSCFAVFVRPNTKGRDVAVQKDHQDQLPDVPLWSSELLEWQDAFLRRMDGKLGYECIEFATSFARYDISSTDQDRRFAQAVNKAILELRERLPAGWLDGARFHGRPVFAHYSQPLRWRAPATTLYSFVTCLDIHSTLQADSCLARTPMSFLQAREQCHRGSPSSQVLARKIYAEFTEILQRKTPPSSSPNSTLGFGKRSVSLQSPIRTRTSSRANMVPPVSASTSDKAPPEADIVELVGLEGSCSPFRPAAISANEIYKTTEVIVQSDNRSDLSDATYAPAPGLSHRATAGNPDSELTFVDELFAAARLSVPARLG